MQILCQPKDVLGEGPIWDHRSDRLLWVDVLRGIVHSWGRDGRIREVLHVDMQVGSIALDGGSADLLLATSEGLFRWSASSVSLQPLANPIAGQRIRFNDGRVDRAGRFWVGTMALDPRRYTEPVGALYRYEAEGGVQLMEAGLTLSNGLDWSPDGSTLYLTDTMRRKIYAYDFDLMEGTIRNRRDWVLVPASDGYPDGLIVDRSGNIWSASFGGGAIRQYDPSGTLIKKISVPVSCPTAMTFGGPGYLSAFITTSRHTLPADHGEECAGSVLTADLGVAGRPQGLFGQRINSI